MQLSQVPDIKGNCHYVSLDGLQIMEYILHENPAYLFIYLKKKMI